MDGNRRRKEVEWNISMKMESSRVCGTVSYNGELWNAWHKCGD